MGMAPEWEADINMGSIDVGMGIHHAAYHNSSSMVVAPGFSLQAPAAAGQHHHHHHHLYGGPPPAADAMRVDQLLDLSNAGAAHDFFPPGAADINNSNAAHHAGAGAGRDEPSARPASDHHGSFNLSFADDLYLPVPSEEAAELEWLSNFVDDSYPDMPNYPPEVQSAIANAGGRVDDAGQHENNSSAPGRGARSKRSRATSAVSDAAWHSLSASSSSDLSSSNKPPAARSSEAEEGGVRRRCTHCASEKTPQWRTGPLGPKTLCNACGVRYKSGRLVPEYRPAASPTFMLTQHSNSHRKVMELRRQKELILLRGNAASGSGSGGAAELIFRDYGHDVC
uniref:GATA-type domain-containing protein n=1 Tax=Arundo donax TaxID=35708 RepID=A0A0A9GYF6_ARUDO